ncbi:hypothetical protein ACQPW3_23565 [Actinosynnema sp. CA-248983]
MGVQGDAVLAEKVVERVGARRTVAVATVAPSGTKVAVVGAPLDADFEIGSISKGVTGLLYADALDRREIDPSTTLGDLLPLGDAPAAGVTLSSAASPKPSSTAPPPAPRPWTRSPTSPAASSASAPPG